MTPAPSIALIIAPNGLGHARRSLAVVARLVQQLGRHGDVDVVAADWQRRRLAPWWALDVLDAADARWHDGVTEPGVSWHTDPDGYADGRLVAWEDRLGNVPALVSTDLVVSDNLPGVLTHRPDAVLMGSFLWSDVLGAAHPESHAVRTYVSHEHRLLDTYRPPMICVGDLAMPGVVDRTRPLPVGWMCPPEAAWSDDDAAGVAVLGGRTGAAGQLLAADAARLVAAGVRVLVQDDLVPQVPEAEGFDYTEAAWASTAVVVARPGVGTLTDCVARGIPLIARSEVGNVEIEFLAGRVAALGIGLDAGSQPDVDIVGLVNEARQHRDRVRHTMAALDRGGIGAAADVLRNRLSR